MLNMKKSKNNARNYSKLLKKASRNRGLPQHKKTHLWRKKRDESLKTHGDRWCHSTLLRNYYVGKQMHILVARFYFYYNQFSPHKRTPELLNSNTLGV
jgi:hypothetical protein